MTPVGQPGRTARRTRKKHGQTNGRRLARCNAAKAWTHSRVNGATQHESDARCSQGQSPGRQSRASAFPVN